jgi:hypothetical protein
MMLNNKVAEPIQAVGTISNMSYHGNAMNGRILLLDELHKIE